MISTEAARFIPCQDNLYQVEIPRRDPLYELWFRRFPRLRNDFTLIHRHKELEICYFPNDRGSFFINDRVYPIEPGDVHIVNGNEFHQPILEDGGKKGARVIYFEPSFLGAESISQPWMSAFLFASHLGLNRIGQHTRLQEIITEFVSVYESENSSWPQLCRGILGYILALVGEVFEKEVDGKSPLGSPVAFTQFARVVDHVKRNSSEAIRVANLYELAGLSKSQFCVRFKEVFGMSISRYIQRERVNRASALLCSTTMSVTEICYACGFNWLGYFNKAFKTWTGMCPKEYRNRIGTFEMTK